MQIYKTSLFHSKPTPRWNLTSEECVQIYHGLNMKFVLDDTMPAYNGPISTSFSETTAFQFSKQIGSVWRIQPSLINKFKFITGICVDWISCHPEEDEMLLINQYIPIVRCTNFDNNIQN